MPQCVCLDRKKRGSSVANFTLTLSKFNFVLFIFVILKLNSYGVYVCNMLLNCSDELHCYEAQQFRSSHRRCSIRKGVLKNFAKFTAKHLCQSLIFNKVAGLRPPTLLKKRLQLTCFPVNFVKFLRKPISIKHLRWLLLFT